MTGPLDREWQRYSIEKHTDKALSHLLRNAFGVK
jgi:hypothetical protein